MEKVLADNRVYLRFIYVLSVVVPLVVAILIIGPWKLSGEMDWVKYLPGLNAFINSTTVLILLFALYAIKRKQISIHRNLMMSALVLGFVFLISYIIYHASVDSVKFGDVDGDGTLSANELTTVGGTRLLYLFFLASHIILSIVVVPFVLFAFYYSLTGKIEKHKRIVKLTFPIWLYVSATGVLVYLMINSYYQW